MTLVDIQKGYMNVGEGLVMELEWVGFFRQEKGKDPVFYVRNGYQFTAKQTPQWESGLLKTAVDILFLPTKINPLVLAGITAADNMFSIGPGSLAVNLVDMETGDVQVELRGGPWYHTTHLNFQKLNGDWVLENMNP